MTQLSISSKERKSIVRTPSSGSATRVASRGSLASPAIANPAAPATRRRRATKPALPAPGRLTQLADELERVREEERTATARDIHDDIGGALAALKMRYGRLRHELSTQPAGSTSTLVAEGLAEIGSMIDAAAAATQGVMRSLRPGALQHGLVAAIESATVDFTQRTGVKCRFTTNHDGAELPAAHSTAIYRICQEALTNISKHAQASLVAVELFRDRSKVTLEIIDNGTGLATADLSKTDSFGIRGMRERAESFGGWLEVDGKPGAGTTVMLQIPLRRVQDIVR